MLGSGIQTDAIPAAEINIIEAHSEGLASVSIVKLSHIQKISNFFSQNSRNLAFFFQWSRNDKFYQIAYRGILPYG
jgi:hypothetical protein